MTMFRQFGALGVVVVVLVGCAGKPSAGGPSEGRSNTVVPMDPADSPIELGRQMASAASQQIKVRPVLPGGPGYRYETYAWCAATGQYVDNSRARYRALCERRGGRWDSYAFCVAPGSGREVLFMGKVSSFGLSGVQCPGVQSEVIEPRGSLNDPEYQRVLRIQGFVPEAERVAKRALDDWQRRDEADNEARRMASERARLDREWPTMRVRGTQVCKEYQGTTWMAFVEDESAGKLKLMIHRGFRTQVPSISVTPSAPVIWEEAIYWRLC